MLADDYPRVRRAAIAVLEELQPDGAWREHLVYECYIPAGEFVMGTDKEAHRVHLDAFYIGRYPVTNADYKRHATDLKIPHGKADHPLVGIPWQYAREHADWAGMRLLTEAEWEKAASWAGEQEGKRKYPWGDEFDKAKCNVRDSLIWDTTPVGKYSPQGDSFYGCADMFGNVWEWTSSLWKDYPYQANDGREDMDRDGLRVVRGRSFKSVWQWADVTERTMGGQRSGKSNRGFRMGVSAPSLSDGWRIPLDPEILIPRVMMERAQRAAAAGES
jgi:formylglycine-generating enzyme required for sulfatase activity